MTVDKCSICNEKLSWSTPRHPKLVCPVCSSHVTDANGRELDFYNVSMSGGCEGVYKDTKKPYPGYVCYIKGIKCNADEYRFGGIVYERADGK